MERYQSPLQSGLLIRLVSVEQASACIDDVRTGQEFILAQQDGNLVIKCFGQALRCGFVQPKVEDSKIKKKVQSLLTDGGNEAVEKLLGTFTHATSKRGISEELLTKIKESFRVLAFLIMDNSHDMFPDSAETERSDLYKDLVNEIVSLANNARNWSPTHQKIYEMARDKFQSMVTSVKDNRDTATPKAVIKFLKSEQINSKPSPRSQRSNSTSSGRPSKSTPTAESSDSNRPGQRGGRRAITLT
ncbi:hypothetical protein HDU76_012172, partial [Blyttiomyces sp. JEL0837]